MSSRYLEGKDGIGSPKDNLLNGLYLIKNTTRGGGGQKSPIFWQHGLWTALSFSKKYCVCCLKLLQLESLAIVQNKAKYALGRLKCHNLMIFKHNWVKMLNNFAYFSFPRASARSGS